MTGSHCPPALMGADLVQTLDPWLSSLMDSSFILMWALLSHWSSDALLEEQLCFLGLVPVVNIRDETLIGVPEALMSDMGRDGGGRVQALGTGLLVGTGKATD